MYSKNEISYGDEFTSAGLADYLATNHFYLSNKSIRPDYFKLLGENGNPKILMHIEDLPSSNKMRTLDIWNKLDFYNYKTLLERAILQYLSKLEIQFHKSKKECDKCKGKTTFSNSSLIYTLDDPDDFSENLLSSSNLVEIKNSIDYNFAQRDNPELRDGSLIIEKIDAFFEKSDKKIICNRCEPEFRSELKWKRLESKSLPMKKAKNIVRKIVKSSQREDIEKILQILEETKKSNFNDCSRVAINIIFNLHYVINDLLSSNEFGPKFASVLDVWVDKLISERPSMATNPIITSIVICIFRTENIDHIKKILSYIFGFPEKTYFIFRELTIFPIIDDLFDVLIDYYNNDQIDERAVLNSISGFVFAPNQQYIQRLLEYFDRLAPHLQKHLIVELATKGNAELMERLQSLLTENNNSCFEKPVSQKIIEEFEETYNEFKEKNDVEQKLKDIQEKKMGEEQKKMNNLYEVFKQKRATTKTTVRDLTGILLKNYRAVIKEHIETYKDEFIAYFASNKESLVGFDIEEIYNQSFLVMALEIKPDLNFFIKIITVDSIYPIRRYMNSIPSRIRKWLADVKSKYVMTHGTNEEEAAIIDQTGHEQINTQ